MREPIQFFIQLRPGNTVIDGTSISYESLKSSQKGTASIRPVQNVFQYFKSEYYYAIKFENIDEVKIVIEDYIRYYSTQRISLKFNGLSQVGYRLKSYQGRN